MQSRRRTVMLRLRAEDHRASDSVLAALGSRFPKKRSARKPLEEPAVLLIFLAMNE
jgi:hypothetical protein